MKLQVIPNIDWNKIVADLKMDPNQNHDPEEVVHEICHVYDCKKDEAFKLIGNQRDVASIINLTYKANYAKDRAEIRVSAMTYLVLEPLGHANLRLILDNMYGNLALLNLNNKEEYIDKCNKVFLKFIRDDKVQCQANKVREFLLTFRVFIDI